MSEAPIADVLREGIRQRLLPPGTPLVQQTIADELGVSRIPVRDALQRLASEGLVTLGEDGARVTVLTPAEVDELWSLRALLEPAMATAIVRNATGHDIDELRALVADMDRADDVDRWSNLNYAFHDRLYRSSGLAHHRTLALRVLNLIEPHSRVAADLLQQRGAAQAEHHDMIDALERADADALRNLLAVHSARARAALVDYVQDQASVAGDSRTIDAARRLAERLVSQRP